jgi:hypothetical protein
MATFEPTLPLGDRRRSGPTDFIRYLAGLVREPDAGGTRLSTLSPSLMQDLLRFEQSGRPPELLEVLAASIRHGRPLKVHLRGEGRPMALTIIPAERLVHGPVPMAELLTMRLADLEVLLVEPGTDTATAARDAAEGIFAPLGVLSWELAMRGARGDLLPEIPARAAYRIPPGVNLGAIDTGGSIDAAVARLRRATTNLREMAAWPGFDRERAMRLLNALYLQAALMVTRSHPAATNDDWAP